MMFKTFPVLMTSNYTLREIITSDTEEIMSIFSNHNVTKYYDIETFVDMRQASELIDIFSDAYRNKSGVRWGITKKGSDSIIGTCGYFHINNENYRAEIGFEIAHKHWGNGIMNEVLPVVVEFGFEYIKLNRIEALVTPGNVASINLLKKFRFQKEGVLRQNLYFRGEFHDDLCFSVLKQDWDVA